MRKKFGEKKKMFLVLLLAMVLCLNAFGTKVLADGVSDDSDTGNAAVTNVQETAEDNNSEQKEESKPSENTEETPSQNAEEKTEETTDQSQDASSSESSQETPAEKAVEPVQEEVQEPSQENAQEPAKENEAATDPNAKTENNGDVEKNDVKEETKDSQEGEATDPAANNETAPEESAPVEEVPAEEEPTAEELLAQQMMLAELAAGDPVSLNEEGQKTPFITNIDVVDSDNDSVLSKYIKGVNIKYFTDSAKIKVVIKDYVQIEEIPEEVNGQTVTRTETKELVEGICFNVDGTDQLVTEYSENESSNERTYAYTVSGEGNHYLSSIWIKRIDDEAKCDEKAQDVVLSIYNEDSDNATIQQGFITIPTEENNEEIWYSSVVNKENPYIAFKASTTRYIEKIYVVGQPFIAERPIGLWTNDNTPAKTGKNELDCKIHFSGIEGTDNVKLYVVYSAGDDKTTDDVTVNIDNTAPSTDTFAWKTLGDLFERGNYTYTKNPVQVKFTTRGDADYSRWRSTSGFSHFEYKLESDTEPRVVNITETDDEACLVSGVSESINSQSETTIKVAEIWLVDNAGNRGQVALDGDRIPVIVYDANKPLTDFGTSTLQSAYTASDGSKIFRAGTKGKILITDYSPLDSNLFNVNYLLNGKEKTLKKSASSDDKRATFEYTLDKDGTYVLQAKSSDIIGNTATDKSETLVVDAKAPALTITCAQDGRKFDPEGEDKSFINGHVTVSVNMNEIHPDFTKSAVVVSCSDVNGGVSENTYNGDNWSGVFGEENHSISVNLSTDGIYRITAYAEDVVGNKSTEQTVAFTVDTTKPLIEVKFDQNDPRNEKYYNVARTATITVTDASFDDQKVNLKLDEQYGSAKESGWKNDSNTVHTKTITFSSDGIYSFKVSCEDRAGNKSDEITEKEFIIDTTAPEVKVDYDNNSAVNEYYYNSTRTASIKIKEMSFDGELVKIGTMPLDGVTTTPKASFSTSGDDCNGSIVFSEDGVYGYTIEVTDLAGNKADIYTSDKFVIDTTKPEISFTGVENFSANNGTVAPVVACVEKNMDEQVSQVTVTGANHGVVSHATSMVKTERGTDIRLSDFEHTKENDDLYTVDVTVKDLAGNEATDKIVFSVNRFGSVYVLNDAAKTLNEKYYTTKPQEITITEINVDDLVQKDVTIGCDGDYTNLQEGKALDVTKEGTDETWKRYTYSIKKSAFGKDGIYAVGVSSVDRATNSQDSRSRDAAVDFALDTTKPSIATPDLKDNDIYEEEEHKVNMNVTDNMSLENLKIYQDKELLGEYSKAELDENMGTVQFTIEADTKPHDIHVLAGDTAGNKVEVIYRNIYVGSIEEEEKAAIIQETTIDEQDTAGSDTQDNLIATENGKTSSLKKMQKFAGYTMAGLLVIAAGIGTGLLFVRKKE